MSIEERLIRYCRIDTQSDPLNSGVVPSTEKQFDLARLLVKELQEMGVEDACVDEHCYVYAHLASNMDKDVKKTGFIAHMDTAPDFSGTGVTPVIIECFDGNDIQLNADTVTRMADFPYMRKLEGKRLIVTDGTTLLGADDKAGVAAIMEAVQYLCKNPEVKHGQVSVCFTPDEEIGNGPSHFDVKRFDADFAYTMDGDRVNEAADETFSAASAVVTFRGFSIHPGEAKNKMVNAAANACRFQAMLPQYMVPEHTEGKEGFIHLTGMKGNTEAAELKYILRDHDRDLLNVKKQILEQAVSYMKKTCGEDSIALEIKDSYRNMKEVLDRYPYVMETAEKAIRALGLEPERVSVRGGTDGAEISYMGLPCPNLGTGGGNFHGPFEYCDVQELETACRLILKITELTASEA